MSHGDVAKQPGNNSEFGFVCNKKYHHPNIFCIFIFSIKKIKYSVKIYSRPPSPPSKLKGLKSRKKTKSKNMVVYSKVRVVNQTWWKTPPRTVHMEYMAYRRPLSTMDWPRWPKSVYAKKQSDYMWTWTKKFQWKRVVTACDFVSSDVFFLLLVLHVKLSQCCFFLLSLEKFCISQEK